MKQGEAKESILEILAIVMMVAGCAVGLVIAVAFIYMMIRVMLSM